MTGRRLSPVRPADGRMPGAWRRRGGSGPGAYKALLGAAALPHPTHPPCASTVAAARAATAVHGACQPGVQVGRTHRRTQPQPAQHRPSTPWIRAVAAHRANNGKHWDDGRRLLRGPRRDPGLGELHLQHQSHQGGAGCLRGSVLRAA
eukprot:scaffold443_cov527-Prasinococcus_capsulatus_cf.AAC.17